MHLWYLVAHIASVHSNPLPGFFWHVFPKHAPDVHWVCVVQPASMGRSRQNFRDWKFMYLLEQHFGCPLKAPASSKLR